jgi:hypothetical protein
MSVCGPCNRCGSHAARVWDKKSALFLVIATRGRSSALDLGAHRGPVEQRLIGELFTPVIRSSSVSATTKSAPCLLRLMVVRVTR